MLVRIAYVVCASVGSFVGFLRLLLYLYTCALPDGSDAALMEDLETANRCALCVYI